jgi:ribosomal protein L7/L12
MPLCQYCRHLNPVGVDRCQKCQRWIGVGPEPPSQTAPAAVPTVASRVQPPQKPAPPSSPQRNLNEEVRQVLLREGKIQAVKFYREQTHVGLAEAKAAVEAIEAGQGRTASAAPSEEALLSLLRAGRKIDAIRVYRQQSGAGLKDAKDHIEDLARRHGIRTPTASCGTAALAILAMITLIVLWLA